jgi:hypothetical protein
MGLHNKVLLGEVRIESLTDEELLSLMKCKRFYKPSFDVFTLCSDEIKQRRNQRLNQRIYICPECRQTTEIDIHMKRR